jgi:hypothetical protein
VRPDRERRVAGLIPVILRASLLAPRKQDANRNSDESKQSEPLLGLSDFLGPCDADSSGLLGMVGHWISPIDRSVDMDVHRTTNCNECDEADHHGGEYNETVLQGTHLKVLLAMPEAPGNIRIHDAASRREPSRRDPPSLQHTLVICTKRMRPGNPRQLAAPNGQAIWPFEAAPCRHGDRPDVAIVA